MADKPVGRRGLQAVYCVPLGTPTPPERVGGTGRLYQGGGAADGGDGGEGGGSTASSRG